MAEISLGRWFTILCFVVQLTSSIFAYQSMNAEDALALMQYQDTIGEGFLKPVGKYLEKSNISDAFQCFRDILIWQRNLTNLWALQMHDANGKLPPGLLTGNWQTLGQFRECLSIETLHGEHRIRGKYCLAKLPMSPQPSDVFTSNEIKPRLSNVDEYNRLVLVWGVCFPDSCRAEEIQKLIRDALESANVTLPKGVTVPEKECSTIDPLEWTGGDIAAATIAGIFVTLMLLSTGYDLFTRKIGNANSRLHQLLISFSVYTNTAKLTKVNKNSSTLRCIHGIRVFSILWVIIGHRYISILMYPLLNSSDMFEWIKTYQSTLIMGGRLAVDTFFVLSGLLLSYLFFKQHENRKSFNLLTFYVHRLVRLWPAVGATIFAQATLYKHIGSGPYWNVAVEITVKNCVKYWWSALLYVQNYVNPLDLCVGQLWYLCIDMHLYILSPILLYPLLRRTKIGIANVVFWLLVALAVNIGITYQNDWAAAVFSLQNDAEAFTKYYYMPTHMRATPWILGFATGYLLYRTSKKDIKISKVLLILGWAASFAIMGAVVLGLKPLQALDHEISKLDDGTYNAFARTGWSLAVIWMIFACVHGYGGPVNWFLSLRIWELLGRFTYSMYLLHLMVQYWQLPQMTVTGEFSHLSYVYHFFGDIIMTLLVSYVWIMAFESPFLALEKVVLGKEKYRATPK